MTKHDPVEGRQRETKKDKPGNRDATGPSRRGTKGDKPGNHDETGPSRRETKGDKPGNHDDKGRLTWTGSSSAVISRSISRFLDGTS